MTVELIRQRICDKVAILSPGQVSVTVSGIVVRNDGSVSARVKATDLETGAKTDYGRSIFNGVDD